MRCIRVCQLPEENPWPVEPKPPRATVVVPLRPVDGTAAPDGRNAVDVEVCVDDRRQVEPPDEPQRE
jgi:hypothetical protein